LIQRASKAGQLRAAGWDRLLRGRDFYLSVDALELVEGSVPSAPLYLMCLDAAGCLLAGLPCYRFESGHRLPDYVRLDRVLEAILARSEVRGARGLASALMPNLFCGARPPSYSRLLTLPAESSQRRRLVDRMLLEVEAAARDLAARSIWFPFVDEDDVGLRQGLLAAGYAEFPSAYCCILEVPAGGLQAYLRRFSSDRRTSILRELRRLQGAGVRLSVTAATEERVDELVPLRLSHARKHAIPTPPQHLADDLVRLIRRLPGRILLSQASSAGSLRAFALFIRSEEELYARYVGFDYQFQGKLPLYFAVLFYAPLDYAAAEGISRIEYGAASYEAKLSRGCRAIYQLSYVRCLEPELQVTLESVLDQVDGKTPFVIA
jgi:uncharacterized protein